METLAQIIGGADRDNTKGESFTGGDGERYPVHGRARYFAQRRAVAIEALIKRLEKGEDRAKIRSEVAALYPTLRDHALAFQPDDEDNFHRGRQRICSCALFTEMINNVLVDHSAPYDTFDLLCSLEDFNSHPIVDIICKDDAASTLRDTPFGSPRFLPALREYLGVDLEEAPRKPLLNPLVVGQLSALNLDLLAREELEMLPYVEKWEKAFADKSSA